MRAMTPEQFRECQEGTVFAYGQPWAFSSLLILDEHVMGDGYWGFWATNPMWVDAEDCSQATERLQDMLENGASHPMEDACSKYMSYDGDVMSVFLVLEKADIDRLVAKMRPPTMEVV